MPEWGTASYSGDQYNPVISAFPGAVFLHGAEWHLAFQTRDANPNGNSVTLRHARIALFANNDPLFVGQDVHAYENVCPDLRGGGAPGVNAGYWGDYNDITFLGFTETQSPRWIATFTDSRDGCPTQWDYFSKHAHVGVGIVHD